VIDFGLALVADAEAKDPADHRRAGGRHAALHGARAGDRRAARLTAPICSRSGSSSTSCWPDCLPFDGTPTEVARQNLARCCRPIARAIGRTVDPLLEGWSWAG
jgi:hypothetical protein